MTMTALLGFLGVSLAVGVTLPQAWLVAVRGRLGGVSFASMGNSAMSSWVWVFFAFGTADWWLGVSSAVYALGYSLMAVSFGLRGGSLRDWRVTALWGLTLAGAIWLTLAGMGVLGVVLTFGAWAFGAPQVVAAMRSRNLDGISVTSWSILGLDAAIWLAYGALVSELVLVFWATSMLSFAICVLGRVWYVRKAHTPAPELDLVAAEAA